MIIAASSVAFSRNILSSFVFLDFFIAHFIFECFRASSRRPQVKIEVKGGRQECPPYTTMAADFLNSRLASGSGLGSGQQGKTGSVQSLMTSSQFIS